jgi:import receptor subunit TOM70
LFKADPIFYSNRAACYANLGFNDRVIEDCNEALALDPIYVKALNRRAHALEKKVDLENALYGNYHSYSVLYPVWFNAAL